MAVQPGHRIPETLMAAANLILQAKALNNRREQQEREAEMRFSAQAELLKYREEMLNIKEKTLALGTQREERLAKGQEQKLKQGERGLQLKETLAKTKGATGPNALQAMRQRRLMLQLIEDDAAMRVDADPDLQVFSDTQRLISEKNRVEGLINQRIASFASKESDPDITAMRGQVSKIERELMGRGHFKRDSLLQAGVPTTLDMAKQFLPDAKFLDEPEGDQKSVLPTPPTVEPTSQSDFSFDRALQGALGKNPEYTPQSAVGSFKSEIQRLNGSDPSGNQSKLFRHRIYQELIKSGMKNTDAGLTIQNWGL